MNFLSKLLKVITMIPAMIIGVENLFAGLKNGSQKQATVLDFFETSINFAEAISAKDIVDEKAFREGVKEANDGVVKMLNASIWYKRK